MEKEFNVDTKIETVTEKSNNHGNNSVNFVNFTKKYPKSKEIVVENKDVKKETKENVKLESEEVKKESEEVKKVEKVKVSKNKGKVISVSPLHIIVKNDKGHAFRFNGKYNVKVGDTFEY